jgi:futalosine hydrolase
VNILLVAATEGELPPLAASAAHRVTPLITGVGMVATAARCAAALAGGGIDLAINVGVCGSFNSRLTPGTVVHVISERFSELGAQDGDGFLTLHELNLLGTDESPYRAGLLTNADPPAMPALRRLPAVAGITVNTVHGNAEAIARVVDRFHPDVESMEGGAFMYACLLQGVKFAQVRAVSNIVERRNRAAWKLPDALTALRAATTEILNQA